MNPLSVRAQRAKPETDFLFVAVPQCAFPDMPALKLLEELQKGRCLLDLKLSFYIDANRRYSVLTR
jgi:hypothetical protein